MKMKKIKINIHEPAKYAAVALFIDQEATIELIKELRARISWNFPVEEGGFDQYLKSISYQLDNEQIETLREVRDRHWGIENRREAYYQKEKEELEQKLLNWQNPRFHFDKHIDDFFHKYSINSELKRSLIKATICNEVTELDFTGRKMAGKYPEIKRNRELFWKNTYEVPRLGYRLLAKEEDMSANTISSAIKTYQKRLSDYQKETFS